MTWTDRLLACALCLMLAGAGAVATSTYAESATSCGSLLEPRASLPGSEELCASFVDGRRHLVVTLVVLAVLAVAGAVAARGRGGRPAGEPGPALVLLGLLVPAVAYLVLVVGAASGGQETGSEVVDELVLAAGAAGVLVSAQAATRMGLERRWALAAAALSLPLTWVALYAEALGGKGPLVSGAFGGGVSPSFLLSAVPLAAALAVARGAQRSGRWMPPSAPSSAVLLLGAGALGACVVNLGAVPGTSEVSRPLALALIAVPSVIACARVPRRVPSELERVEAA